MRKNHVRRAAMDKVLDNILFLEEVFADRTNEEMPELLFLELAKSFELKPVGVQRQGLEGVKP